MKKIINAILVVVSFLATTSCLKEDVNPSTGIPNPVAAVLVVRDVYKDADVKLGPEVLTGAHLTGGIVISDHSSHNFPEDEIVIQNKWRGLVRGLILKVDASLAAGFIPGDSIHVDLDGAVITRIDGALSVTGLTAEKITKVSSGHDTPVRVVSMSRFNSRFGEYESTLVSFTADVSPFPQEGETLSGSKTLNDGADNTVILFTEEEAPFAEEKIAPSATFQGIAYRSGTSHQLRMRSLGDMMFPSGPIYSGYPETFESPEATAKGSYNMPAINNNIDLTTGNWKLEQAILATTAGRDRIVSGKQAIRMQQGLSVPGYLQMNYDVLNGASKVTFFYGSYYEDVSCTFQLEYSTDGGTTWTIIEPVITDAHKFSTSSSAKQATYLMDIDGPVRFRLVKLGLGVSNGTTILNGRLGIDDFAIYQNY